VGPRGKKLQSVVVETNGKTLIDFIRTIPRDRHLCLEEGSHANWLYEILSPHVQEIVVTGVRRSRGPKSDKRDAFQLAEQLRVGSLESRVYKGRGSFALLGSLSRAYTTLVSDSVRIQNRIKSVYRSRGIAANGKSVYAHATRVAMMKKLRANIRPRVSPLYLELDAVNALKKAAAKEMIHEARKHSIYAVLQSIPGLGNIRSAQLLPIVVTPYRFGNKRSLWNYCGLGIVMRSSSDWVRAPDGRWARTNVQKTRGLNRNFNHTLKDIFKGAATTVIRRQDGPLYRHYQSLLDGGTKPNLAKLTIARQIAAIALAVWKSQERYDPRKLTTSK
jgi:hypothetical protein